MPHLTLMIKEELSKGSLIPKLHHFLLVHKIKLSVLDTQELVHFSALETESVDLEEFVNVPKDGQDSPVTSNNAQSPLPTTKSVPETEYAPKKEPVIVSQGSKEKNVKPTPVHPDVQTTESVTLETTCVLVTQDGVELTVLKISSQNVERQQPADNVPSKQSASGVKQIKPVSLETSMVLFLNTAQLGNTEHVILSLSELLVIFLLLFASCFYC